MKFKNLLICAVALVTFASCTKDEPAKVPDVEISFSAPITGAVTKAVPGKITTYPKDEKFAVYALYHKTKPSSNVYYADKWEGGSLYMDNVVCAFDGTSSWVPENYKYYWPKEGYLSFAAYSPADIGERCRISYGKEGLIIEKFKADTIDLLFSQRASYKNFNNQDDDPENPAYTGVDIKFHHALASVKFKIRKADEYEGTELQLKGLYINDLTIIGDFHENIQDHWPEQLRFPDGLKRSPGFWGAGPNVNSRGTLSILSIDALEDEMNDGRFDEDGNALYDEIVLPGQIITTNPKYVKSNSGKIKDYFVIPQSFLVDFEEDWWYQYIELELVYTIDPPGETTPPVYQTQKIPLEGIKHKYNGDSGSLGNYERWDMYDEYGGWEEGFEYTYTITIGLNEIKLEPIVREWIETVVVDGDENLEISGETNGLKENNSAL